MKNTFDVRITLIVPLDMTFHDAQELFLADLPLNFGKAKLHDARIVKGLVDEDDVPVKMPEED